MIAKTANTAQLEYNGQPIVLNANGGGLQAALRPPQTAGPANVQAPGLVAAPPVQPPAPAPSPANPPQGNPVTPVNSPATTSAQAPGLLANQTTAAPSNVGTVQQMILDQMNRLKNPVTAEDPVIAAQQQSFNVENARGLDAEKAALAELAYARNQIGSGGYETRVQRALEGSAARTSGNLANLLARESDKRDNLLAQYTNTGAQYEMSDKQLAQRKNEFDKTFDQNAQQFAAQMGFNYAQLSQQDQQFVKKLAFDQWNAEQGFAISREGMASSAGIAGAQIGYQREKDARSEALFRQQNTDELIAARIAAELAALKSGVAF